MRSAIRWSIAPTAAMKSSNCATRNNRTAAAAAAAPPAAAVARNQQLNSMNIVQLDVATVGAGRPPFCAAASTAAAITPTKLNVGRNSSSMSSSSYRFNCHYRLQAIRVIEVQSKVKRLVSNLIIF